MTPTRSGLLLGAGLALGIAVGAAGSALAASPTPGGGSAGATGGTTPWSQMMGGWGGGMMGGWASNVAPSASFGPGMMWSLDPSQRAAVLQACDEANDAMHAWASGDGSPAPSTR